MQLLLLVLQPLWGSPRTMDVGVDTAPVFTSFGVVWHAQLCCHLAAACCWPTCDPGVMSGCWRIVCFCPSDWNLRDIRPYAVQWSKTSSVAMEVNVMSHQRNIRILDACRPVGIER